jgi:hypothetical protein
VVGHLKTLAVSRANDERSKRCGVARLFDRVDGHGVKLKHLSCACKFQDSVELSRNDSVEMEIATVPVAAVGVPPMALTREGATPFGALTARSIWSAGRRPVRARRARSPKLTEPLRLSSRRSCCVRPRGIVAVMHRQAHIVFSRPEGQNNSHIAEILFMAMNEGFECGLEFPCFVGRFAPIAIASEEPFCPAVLDKNSHERDKANPAWH